MRSMAALLAALLATSVVSGVRVNILGFAAPAPASADKPVADLLFSLSASQATYRAADRLVLEGLQATAQVFNTETNAATAYPLGTFTNATAVAPFAATWAAAPDAVMYFIHDGSAAKALVQLSQPAYDAKTGQLAFAARMLPADAQQLSFARGATARAAIDAANGLAGSLLTEAPIGAKLTSVALFIDGDSTQVSTAATTKDYWGWHHGHRHYYRSSGNSWGQSSSWGQSNSNNNSPPQNQGSNQSPTYLPTNNNNNAGSNSNGNNVNINNNNVVNGSNGGNTNINNNNVVNNGGGTTNINNNNVPSSGNGTSNVNNNNAG